MKLIITLIFIIFTTIVNSQLLRNGRYKYNHIKDSWELYNYQTFLQKFPYSKYVIDVKNRLTCLNRQIDFQNTAILSDTTSQIDFLVKYKKCDFCYNYTNYPYLSLIDKNKDLDSIQNKLEELRSQFYWKNIILYERNEIDRFEYFLKRFPNSTFKISANDTVKIRRDRLAWTKAVSRDEYLGFSEYITDFPDGHYILTAQKLSEIYFLGEKLLTSINHQEIANGIKELTSKDPYSKFIDKLMAKMKSIEIKPYEDCIKSKSIKKWVNFENTYKEGYYFDNSNNEIRKLLKLKNKDMRSPYGSEIYFNFVITKYTTQEGVQIQIKQDNQIKELYIKKNETSGLIVQNGNIQIRFSNEPFQTFFMNGQPKYIIFTEFLGEIKFKEYDVP